MSRRIVGPATSAAAASGSAGADQPGLESTTTWLLVRAVVNGTTYSSPQPPGSSELVSYTVQFLKGQLVANDGCNTFVNPETIGRRTIAHPGSGVSGTGVGCPQTALRDAYDLEIIRGSAAWAVAGGQLTLTNATGDVFAFEPFPAGYPSDLAGVRHATTPEKTVDDVAFRIYAEPLDARGQCVTMEFEAPAGTPWQSFTACAEDLSARHLVEPGMVQNLPNHTATLLGVVPEKSVSRAVFRPHGKGDPIDLRLAPMPGTAWEAFYTFVEPAEGGAVTFCDSENKPYPDTWKIPG